jgi:hypothetical protein
MAESDAPKKSETITALDILDISRNEEVMIGQPKDIRNYFEPPRAEKDGDEENEKVAEIRYSKHSWRKHKSTPKDKVTVSTVVKPESIDTKDRIKQPTEETIKDYITTQKERPTNYSEMLLDPFQQINALYLLQYDHEALISNPKLTLAVKAVFHQLIYNEDMIDLIPVYDNIFNDNLYHDIKFTKEVMEPLTAQDLEMLTTSMREQIRQQQIQRQVNLKPPKYAVNEIIGAQDKEGRWWMSQVINVLSCHNQHVYYVSFLGWGEQFNEFIATPYRLNKFNPKKHKYFRPAWIKEKEIAEKGSADEKD